MNKMVANSTTKLPSVAIILINWRGLEDTRACCASLSKLAYQNAKVFVVDNASGDGSAETLQLEFHKFVHVANQKNLGFSGGNNAAISRLLAEDYKYVLLLNNDTIVAPDFLGAMVNAAEADPQIGMVGAKIYFFDSPNVIWFAGGAIDFETFGPFSHVGENSIDQGQHDQPGETDWVTGCCLLARIEALKQVGLLDEAFGYYCEDVDWCMRVKKAGWKIWYEASAKVWHKIGQSTARGNLPAQYYNWRNVLLIARKYLTWQRKIKFYMQVVKCVWCYPTQMAEKSGFVEATVYGILGCGGPIKDMGTAWWSRGAVFLQMKYQGLKRKIRSFF